MTCGIYRIYNKVNGKSYIGQSKNVERRINEHFYSLSRGVHRNHHLQSAFLLYGSENFGHQLIEACEEATLTQREEYWIDAAHHYAGVYNLAKPENGKKMSIEVRQKMSASHLNRKRGPHSEATKQKISETKKARAVECTLKTESVKMSISERNRARSSAKVMNEKRKGRPPTEKEMAHILKLAEKRRASAVRNNVD